MITATAGGVLIAQKSHMIEHARKWSTQARDVDPDGINNYVHS